VTFQATIDDLLRQTGASRTTLRLDRPDSVFPVVAEALAPGIRSIADDTSIDLRASATFKSLERDRQLLIQSDLMAADPAPPAELIELYGARAQMVAPVVRNDALVGIVSVHYSPGPRTWTDDEVAALEQAVGQVLAELA
jgi:maleate isomerase